MENGPTITHPAGCRCGLPFPQIATGDLDIPIRGQLAATNLSLGDEFEPSPVKMVCFEAPFGRRGVWKQDLKDAPGNAHHTLIFADAYAELDDTSLGIPTGIRWKAKKHAPPEVFR
jgi:hypothetical protein